MARIPPRISECGVRDAKTDLEVHVRKIDNVKGICLNPWHCDIQQAMLAMGFAEACVLNTTAYGRARNERKFQRWLLPRALADAIKMRDAKDRSIPIGTHILLAPTGSQKLTNRRSRSGPSGKASSPEKRRKHLAVRFNRDPKHEYVYVR